MPRALGQIDTRKHEAILDAAVEVLDERGVHAPIEEIARRAGVSKQTIYNHYGSKMELVRTLVERRRNRITAPLDKPGADERVEETLTDYARVIQEAVLSGTSVQLLRMGIASASEMPDLARTIYDAGARAARLRLADFLSTVKELSIDNPERAADVFFALVMGGAQMRQLLGLPTEIDPDGIGARARDCAVRFMRAYARHP